MGTRHFYWIFTVPSFASRVGGSYNLFLYLQEHMIMNICTVCLGQEVREGWGGGMSSKSSVKIVQEAQGGGGVSLIAH